MSKRIDPSEISTIVARTPGLAVLCLGIVLAFALLALLLSLPAVR